MVATQMESFNSFKPIDGIISQKLSLDVFSSKIPTNGKKSHKMFAFAQDMGIRN
jgi:hypothetical protein